MENLNKENFWNAMMEQYPLAVEAFRKWIDEYKKEVNWQSLFNPDDNPYVETPKFHDIPYEMQSGIMFRFLRENNTGPGDWLSPKSIKDIIAIEFKNINTKLHG